MNLKTKIEEEALFKGRNINFFQNLHNLGIYTIEDYINAEVIKKPDPYITNQHRAYMRILKYKYLGEPLVVDVLLDKEYKNPLDKQIHLDLMVLGFGSIYPITDGYKLLEEKGYIKLIDIIECYYKKRNLGLKEFYLEYYNNKIRNQIFEESIDDELTKSDKESLDFLRVELVSLLNTRNELDARISSLLSKIYDLGGNKNVNRRK